MIGTDLLLAIQYLNKGELVAIPTETVYGLAANALNPEAVAKVFEAKNRPRFDPLIVHVPSVDKLKDFALRVNDQIEMLANQFWPGPLTIVLPKKDTLDDLISSGLPTAAFRIPNHQMTIELLNKLDFPIVAPSANLFGYISPTSAAHVNDQLGGKVEYILDGGKCKIGIESTIIGFEEGENPVLYRKGAISIADIERTIGPVKDLSTSTNHLKAPGMLKKHYAPSKKLIIGHIDELILNYPPELTAVLSFTSVNPNVQAKHKYILSPDGSLLEAAQNLFGMLREIDKLDISFIIAEMVPNEGIGEAINDRLIRASQ